MEENPTHLVSTNTQGNLHAGPSSTINSIRNAQTLPTASPNLNPALVHPIRTYFAGERLLMDEDSEHEFKATHMTPKPVQKIIDLSYTYVNAFLNTSGGTLYCGVTDDGYVVGNLLTRDQRDHIRKSFDSLVLDSFWPCLDTRMASIHMIKVLPPPELLGVIAPTAPASNASPPFSSTDPSSQSLSSDASMDGTDGDASSNSADMPSRRDKISNRNRDKLKIDLDKIPAHLVGPLGVHHRTGRTEEIVRHYLRVLLASYIG